MISEPSSTMPMMASQVLTLRLLSDDLENLFETFHVTFGLPVVLFKMRQRALQTARPFSF